MATLTLEELAETLAPGQPIAGLDLGTKTIGLSVSDLGRRLATPRPVLKRVKFTQDAEVLLAFAAKEKVVAFVIGSMGTAEPIAWMNPRLWKTQSTSARPRVLLF